jgi:hypothetical protein
LSRWPIPLCRPKRSVDLLLRANLSPENAAAQAWRDWLRTRRLEDASGPEVRLLAPLARRIPRLDPSFPQQALLDGIAKSHWTMTHLMMTESALALDVLRNAGIDFMLFKGAALYAENLRTRRVMADVDILVLPEAIVPASCSLMEAGWRDKHPDLPEPFRERIEKTVGTGYCKGRFGNIDVQRQVFHFCRRDPDLDAELWRRARPGDFVGKKVMVPSHEDSIAIGIAHGMTSGDGDWALDAACRIGACPVEWTRVVDIAERRGLAPVMLAALSYLDELGCEVPSPVLQQLRRSQPTLGEYLKYLDEAFVKEIRGRLPDVVRRPLRDALRPVARLLLPRDFY